MNFNPARMSKIFEMACCQGNHAPKCVEKWLAMKKYLNTCVIEDLRLLSYKSDKLDEYFIPNIFNK